MYICENCFSSKLISDYIIKSGYKLKADFICKCCDNRSTYRIDKYDFRIKIQSIIRKHFEHEYTHGLCGSASMMAKDEDDDISVFLSSSITYSLRDICYELFQIDDETKFYELLSDSTWDSDSVFNCDSYEENWINIGRDWDGSSRIELNWDDFCRNVKHKARYFDHSQFNRINELSKLERTFNTLSKKVSKTF